MKQCASVSSDDLIIRGLVNYRNNTINYKCRFVKFLKLTRKKKPKVNNLQLKFCRYIVFLLYTKIMIISTRRLLTSVTRKVHYSKKLYKNQSNLLLKNGASFVIMTLEGNKAFLVKQKI